MKPAPRTRIRICFFLLCLILASLNGARAQAAQTTVPRSAPLMRDFMGLCVHTVQFRPDLYTSACRMVRDYHPIDWDIGPKGAEWPRFPMALNKVDWQKLYGSWRQSGFSIDMCAQFNRPKANEWDNIERDANTYGFAVGRCFGPGGRNLIESMEIGNEPGEYSDEAYRRLFKSMAEGVRAGDAALTIATCAVTPEKSTRYARSLECFRGLDNLYDVITLHTYAEIEGYPTWRRSYPEDPRIKYLNDVRAVQSWRDRNAPGKPVWITEFGWDASTKPAPATGNFKGWAGSTEIEQARYIVRSLMIFASMGVDRAYIYWFNDKDEPQVHASSGLTRNYTPKPAWHAVAHLYDVLGNWRFERIVQDKPGGIMVFSFAPADAAGKSRIWAAWSPTGSNRRAEQVIDLGGAVCTRAERMALDGAGPVPVAFENAAPDRVKIEIDESPVFLRVTNP